MDANEASQSCRWSRIGLERYAVIVNGLSACRPIDQAKHSPKQIASRGLTYFEELQGVHVARYTAIPESWSRTWHFEDVLLSKEALFGVGCMLQVRRWARRSAWVRQVIRGSMHQPSSTISLRQRSFNGRRCGTRRDVRICGPGNVPCPKPGGTASAGQYNISQDSLRQEAAGMHLTPVLCTTSQTVAQWSSRADARE